MKPSALALAVLLMPTAALAEGPSFDCRTARTPREIAVCGDSGLAKADRDLAAAYGTARRRLPPTASNLLTGDQREFIADLDDGFNVEMWGRGGVPEEARRMHADIRTAITGHHDAIGRLQSEIETRIRFLASLGVDRPGLAGNWGMHGSMLTITAVGAGWTIVYGHPSYGWPKYECHFTAVGKSVGALLVVDGVENTDIGETRQTRLMLRREGAVLTSEEATEEGGGRSACVHSGPVMGTFFALGR